MTSKASEKELGRLRRLPENMLCPNCGRKDTLFGFSAVCWQFKTFVCGECKSAHQSFSHRCKSVTMSNWNMDEIKQLDERNGGGNRIAYERWVAGAPASSRPDEKSSLDTLKRFIDRAYNQKAWERDYHGDAGADREEEQRRHRASAGPENNVIGGNRVDSPQNSSSRGSRLTPPLAATSARAPAPAPAPAQVANLLDDMFDQPAVTSAAPAAQPVAAMPAPQQPFFDPFGMSAGPTAAAPAATAASSMPHMALQAGACAQAAPPFDPFALPNAAAGQPQPMQAQAPQQAQAGAQCGMFNQFCQQQPQQQGMAGFGVAGCANGVAMQPQQAGMHSMGVAGSTPSIGSSSAFGLTSYAGAQAPNGMPMPGGAQTAAAPWQQVPMQQQQQQPFDPFRMPSTNGVGAASPQPMMQMPKAGHAAAPASFDPFAANGFANGQQQHQQQMPMQQQQMQQQQQMSQAGMAQCGIFGAFGQQQQQHQNGMFSGLGGQQAHHVPQQHQPPQQLQQQMQQMQHQHLQQQHLQQQHQPQQHQPQQQQQAADMFDPFAPAAPSRPMAVHA